MRKRTCRGYDAHPCRGAWQRRSLSMAALQVAGLLTIGCIPTSPGAWIENGFKVGPNYHRPPAPVAPEWIEAQDARVQGQDPRDGDWWNVFQDPTLNSLIAAAYQQNLTLLVVGTRVLEARAQQAIAVGNFFPQQQQATGQYSRVGLSRNVANTFPR